MTFYDKCEEETDIYKKYCCIINLLKTNFSWLFYLSIKLLESPPSDRQAIEIMTNDFINFYEKYKSCKKYLESILNDPYLILILRLKLHPKQMTEQTIKQKLKKAKNMNDKAKSYAIESQYLQTLCKELLQQRQFKQQIQSTSYDKFISIATDYYLTCKQIEDDGVIKAKGDLFIFLFSLLDIKHRIKFIEYLISQLESITIDNLLFNLYNYNYYSLIVFKECLEFISQIKSS